MSDIETIVIFWAVGVVIAVVQILGWSQRGLVDPNITYVRAVLYGLLSWLIYPVYGVTWLMRKFKR